MCLFGTFSTCQNDTFFVILLLCHKGTKKIFVYYDFGGVNMWVVENVNGDGSLVKKEFETYQEAKAYAEWTLGTVYYVKT